MIPKKVYPYIHINRNDLSSPSKSLRVGWRFSMTLGLVCTALVFLCNIVVLIWSSRQDRIDNNNFLVFMGNCSSMKTINAWIHLAINILSTLLLGASNYAFQVLVAPTRKEIDTAHALCRSLDIAVPSVSNWKFMTVRRKVLFSILIISSIPLHLLYNSVIFSTDSAIEYRVTVVNSDFLEHTPMISLPMDYNVTDSMGVSQSINRTQTVMNQIWHDVEDGLFIEMDLNGCHDVLATPYKSAYSNVLLFSNISSAEDPLIYGSTYNPADGSDGPLQVYQCDTPRCPYNWTISTFSKNATPLKSCSVQKGQESCTIELSPKLLAMVLICNLLKIVALSYVLFFNVASEPLLTLGDAIASFLERSDQYTNSRGGLAASDIRRNLMLDVPKALATTRSPHGWDQPRRRYYSGASLFRWTSTIQLLLNHWLFGLALVLIFILGLNGPSSGQFPDFSQQWQAGFGALLNGLFFQPYAFNDSTNTFIANSMIANAPQLVLSFIYIAYNGLFTCMSVSAEWAGYICQEKRGLRVTHRTAHQRSTYWLSLPFKISLPLLVTSSILHWLLSQTIYVVRLDFLAPDGTKTKEAINGIAWSPLVLSALLGVMVLLLLALLVFSLQKFPAGIPIVSCDSWAISANCHTSKPAESLKKLQFGVIGDLVDGKYRVGFSSDFARPLVPGEHYE